jgi:hypothetical protein
MPLWSQAKHCCTSQDDHNRKNDQQLEQRESIFSGIRWPSVCRSTLCSLAVHHEILFAASRHPEFHYSCPLRIARSDQAQPRISEDSATVFCKLDANTEV